MKSGRESGGILDVLSPINILQYKLERVVKCSIHQPFQSRCLYITLIIQTKSGSIFMTYYTQRNVAPTDYLSAGTTFPAFI